MARSVAQQLSVAVETRGGDGRITVQLDPPELGRIDLSLDIGESGLRATIAAERPQTGDLLRRHIDILVQELRAAGFAGVDLGFGSGAGQRSRRDGTPQAGTAAREAATAAGILAPDGALPTRTRHTAAGLDLRL